MMDPTAPKNNSTAGDPPAASPTPDPIQPGQFVVSGDEDGVFKRPTSPPPQTPNTQEPFSPSPDSKGISASPLPEPISQPLATEPPLQAPSPAPFSPISPLPPEEPSVSSLNLAGTPPEPNLSPNLSSPPPKEPTPAPSLNENQPNPTPFVSPALGSQPQEEPSRIKKLRLVAIILGVFVLIGVIGGSVWFFVLGKKPINEPAKTESTEQVEEPPALPKKKSGGFSELPPLPIESTSQATDSASQ